MRSIDQPRVLCRVAWLALLAGGAIGLRWQVWRTAKRAALRRGALPASLLRAIPGNPRRAILAVLGPPHASAGFAILAPSILVRSDYVHADTWYYPLDQHRRMVMVVRFERGVARDAGVVQLSMA